MNLEPTIRNAPKILVADDSLIIQKTVLMALKQEGYQVLVSRDISEILSTVRREKPDVILLDLSYPLDADYVGGPSQDGFDRMVTAHFRVGKSSHHHHFRGRPYNIPESSSSIWNRRLLSQAA